MADPSSPSAAAVAPASFPVSLDVRNRSCLVVGGGPVAARKARSLLACGAVVTVIAPELCPEMARLAVAAFERRPYAAGDVNGFRLIFTATGVPAVDGAVAADADAAGIWVNSADDRENCTFTLPAVHRDGAVSVAVSTDGASPALASWLRATVAGDLDGAGALAELLRSARARIKAAGRRTEDTDWGTLLNAELLELVRQGRTADATRLIEETIGL
jgi:precorrin-2 dehydrogenase/sirohydrochlorin ferrochelatase